MTKKLISSVIAGLFAAAPAFAQSDDPMRVEGTGTVGYINNNTQRVRQREAQRVPGPRQRRAVEHRRYRDAAARPGSRATARTSAARTSTCSCAAACTMSSRRGRTSTTSRTRSRRTPSRLTAASAPTRSSRPSRWARCRIPLRRETGATSRWAMTGAIGAGLPSGRGTARSTSGSTATRCPSAEPKSAPRRTARARATASSTSRSRPSTRPTTGASRAATSRARPRLPCAGTTASSTTTTRRCSGRTRTSAATSSTPRTWRRATRSTSSRSRATTATCRGARSCPRATPGRRRRATSDWARPRSTAGPSFPTTLPERQQLQRREHQPVVRAVLDRGAGHQRRHARVLLLDQAREQLDDRPIRQRADAAAGGRPRLRQLHRGERPADADRHGNCDERALQLHQEQRRLRRLVEVPARQPPGLRLGLQRPRPDALRLRQGALEQILDRVQEHHARHGLGPAQVPVRQARLDVQPEQCRDRCRTIPITCCATPPRSTCRATRPTCSSCISTGIRCRPSASRSRVCGARSTTTTPSSVAPAPIARATS